MSWIRQGAQPVLTTWPPAMTTTDRLPRAAAAVARMTARRLPAAGRSGSLSIRAASAGPSRRARPDRSTRAGRVAMERVRIRLRSASGYRDISADTASVCRHAGRDDRRPRLVRFEHRGDGADLDPALHDDGNPSIVGGDPEGHAAVGKTGVPEHRLDDVAVEGARRNGDPFALQHRQFNLGVLPIDVARNKHALPDVEIQPAGDVDDRKHVLRARGHRDRIPFRVIVGEVPRGVDLDGLVLVIAAL